MKGTVTAVLIVMTLGLGGCKSAAAKTLVLDGWWSRDYAKESCRSANDWWKQNQQYVSVLGCAAINSCPELMPRVQACVGDPTSEVRDFEARFATAFASDATCKGINLVRFNSPQESNPQQAKRMGEPNWSLSLDFEPGQIEQPWKMNHSPDSTSKDYYGYTTGKGTSSAIAHIVCGIVNGKGGTLQDQ